jgi:hypothetical protein
MMKKVLVMIVMLITTGMAYAVDERGLSDQQKALLEEQAAKFRGQNAAPGADPGATAKRVGEWVDVGTKIGQAFGGAAREMSIQVNEFAKTPVGVLTAAIITWKFIGGPIMHLVGGVIVLASCWLFMLYINRQKRNVVITYDVEKKDLFGRSVVKSYERGALHDDWAVGSYFWMAVGTIVALITIFTY